MACFIVSAVEAAVVTVAKKVEEKKELKVAETESSSTEETAVKKVPLSKKLGWLSNMLWGGSVLLAFEHIWHGEVVAWFPFLTAMSDPNDAVEMFHEMATVGVCMAALITSVWIGMCFVADKIVKRSEDVSAEPETL